MIIETVEMVAVNFAEWIGNSNWRYIQAGKNKWQLYVESGKTGNIYKWKTTKQLYEMFLKSERERLKNKSLTL